MSDLTCIEITLILGKSTGSSALEVKINGDVVDNILNVESFGEDENYGKIDVECDNQRHIYKFTIHVPEECFWIEDRTLKFKQRVKELVNE